MDHLLAMFWWSRDETLYACTQKTILTVQSLNDIVHVSFGNYGKGAKKSKDAVPISPTPGFISNWLVKGILRDEMDRYPFPDGGYHISLTSYGVSPDVYELNVDCGSCSKHLVNGVVFGMPPDGQCSIDTNRDGLIELFRRLQSIWEPDFGVITRSGRIEWSGHMLVNKPEDEFFYCRP